MQDDGQPRGGTFKLFQRDACRHQTSLIAGTVFQGTELVLSVWFLAIHLISQAKTGLSALALKRHLGVSYPTARLMRHKLMLAMAARVGRDNGSRLAEKGSRAHAAGPLSGGEGPRTRPAMG